MKKLNSVVLKFMQFLHKTKHHCVVWSYCLKSRPHEHSDVILGCIVSLKLFFFFFFKWK